MRLTTELPTHAGEPINLRQLFYAVLQRGGFFTVFKLKQADLNLPGVGISEPVENPEQMPFVPQHVLAVTYAKYLLLYEQALLTGGHVLK